MAFSGRAKFPPPYLDIATDRRDAHTSLDRDDRASTKAACDPDEGVVPEGRAYQEDDLSNFMRRVCVVGLC